MLLAAQADRHTLTPAEPARPSTRWPPPASSQPAAPLLGQPLPVAADWPFVLAVALADGRTQGSISGEWPRRPGAPCQGSQRPMSGRSPTQYKGPVQTRRKRPMCGFRHFFIDCLKIEKQGQVTNEVHTKPKYSTDQQTKTSPCFFQTLMEYSPRAAECSSTPQ